MQLLEGFHKVAANSQIYAIRRRIPKNNSIENEQISVIHFVLLLGQYVFLIY